MYSVQRILFGRRRRVSYITSYFVLPYVCTYDYHETLPTLPGTYRDNVTYLITHIPIAPIYYYPRCLIHNPRPSIIIPSQNPVSSTPPVVSDYRCNKDRTLSSTIVSLALKPAPGILSAH